MAHFYFVDSQQRLIPGKTVALAGDEARHAAKAARLRVGESVQLGDGRGVVAVAQATSVDADRIELVVMATEHTQPLIPPLWLGQALAKSGRDEQAIEQATEVGVARIIPLQAERSVVRWDVAKADKATARWQKIVTQAAKQSIQPWRPIVDQVTTVEDLLGGGHDVQLIALDHRARQSLLDVELEDPAGDRPIAVLVGPEGGWSDGEKAALRDAGVVMAKLGPGVLRASSAGPIALALLHARLRHW